MEKFEKRIEQAKKKETKLCVVLILIAIILLLVGISKSTTDKDGWDTFDRTSESGYYKAEIYYLVGPFAEYSTDDGEVSEEIYSALTTDETYIIVKTGKTTDLPVVGEDVTEDNIDSIEPITIYGYSEKLEEELPEYLVEFWNELYDDNFFTVSNYDEYFGTYSLDVEDQGQTGLIVCYVFAGLFMIIGVTANHERKKRNTKMLETLKELEQEGKLENLKQEYSRETVEQYKKINLDITDSYIINYIPRFKLIKFDDIINVYKANLSGGIEQIVIETRNNEKHYIAQKPIKNKNEEFDRVLEKIRTKIKIGGM